MPTPEWISSSYEYYVGLGQVWPEQPSQPSPYSAAYYELGFRSVRIPEVEVISEIIQEEAITNELPGTEEPTVSLAERLVSAHFVKNAVIVIRHFPADEGQKKSILVPDYPEETLEGHGIPIGDEYLATDRSGAEIEWTTVRDVLESGVLTDYTRTWFGKIKNSSIQPSWHDELAKLHRGQRKK